jgi:hypothetical protein
MKKLAILLASALLAVSACNKDDEADAPVTTLTQIPEGPYKATYTIDGRTVSVTDGTNGFLSPNAFMSKNLLVNSGDTTLLIRASYGVTAQAKGSAERLSIATDSVEFVDTVHMNLTRPSATAFGGYFSRVVPAGPGGVRFTWYAPDGTVWTSNGAQTEQVTYSVTKQGVLENAIEYVNTRIEFNNIILYRDGAPSEMKTLSGGNVHALILNSR